MSNTEKSVDDSASFKPKLKSVVLQDFKGHTCSRVHLNSFTLLIGKNSAGKSSLIQAILALTQWAREGGPLANFYLNGPQVRLGGFQEVLHNAESNNLHRHIGLGVSTQDAELSLDIFAGLPSKATPGSGYGSPEIGNFTFRGETSRAELHQEASSPVYHLLFEEQDVWTEWVGELEVPRYESFPFGRLERIFELPESSPQTQPLFSGASIRDAFDLNVHQETSLELELSRILTRFVALNLNLGKNLMRPKDVEISFCSIAEFLEDVLLKGRRFGTFQRDPLISWTENPWIFLLEVKHEIQSIIRDNFEEVAPKTPYQEITKNVRLTDFGWSTLAGQNDFVLGNDGWPEPPNAISKKKQILIPVFISNYEQTSGRSEPPQQLGPEDIKQVAQFLEINAKKFNGSNQDLDSWRILDNSLSWLNDSHILDYDYSFELRTPVHEARSELASFMDTLSSNIFYLGPLRVDGYSTARRGTIPNSGSPAGNSGELTPLLLLDAMADKTIRKMPFFDHSSSTWSINDCDFEQSINSWFSIFTSRDSKLSVSDSKHGAYVEVDGRTLDQFGTGASQVLPILTLVLTRRPGDTVLIEQPELHLHPGGQQHLADFFLAASVLGIQIIVETHSEYIVNRVRRAVLINPEVDNKKIQMVYFEQEEDGSSKVTNVGVTESGGFADWPQGFFAQTEEDLLDILQALEDREF